MVPDKSDGFGRIGVVMSVVRSIHEAVRVAHKHGSKFFSPETMLWFRSEVYHDVYGVFFVTSEQFNDESPRRFTIRRINWDTGEVTTQSEFQQYETWEEANAEAKALALDWLNFPEP